MNNRQPARNLLVGTFCLVLLGGQDRGLRAQNAYTQIAVVNGGTIAGTVLFTKAAGDKSVFDVTKDQKYCGTIKPAQALSVGPDRGIQNAVVYLEGVTKGKRWKSATTPVLNQNGCEYSPHVSIIPSGSVLEIVNNDPILHNVHLYNLNSVGETICNIAQPVKGQRTMVDRLQLGQCRFLRATCDAGHPWMSAYVVCAEHPYYAVTDSKGQFRLTDIPPGTYTLTMWHEGVRVVKTLMENGKVSKYYYEEPYTETKDIVVSATKAVRADFTLALRGIY